MLSRRERYLRKRKRRGHGAVLIGICLLIILGVKLYWERGDIFGARNILADVPIRPFVETGRIEAGTLPAAWTKSGPLFTYSSEGAFYLLGYDSVGELQWKREFNEKHLVAAGEHLIALAGYNDDRLKLLDLSGRSRISTALPGAVSFVGVYDDLILTATFSKEALLNEEFPGNILQLYGAQGEMIWSLELPGEIVLAAEALPEGGFVLLLVRQGEKDKEFLVAAVSETGEVLYRTAPFGELPLLALDESRGEIVAAVSGKVFRFDKSGELVWEKRLLGTPLEVLAESGDTVLLIEGRSVLSLGKTRKLLYISSSTGETRVLYEGKKSELRRFGGFSQGIFGIEDGLIFLTADGTGRALYGVDDWEDFSVNDDGSQVVVLDSAGNVRLLTVAVPQ